MQDACCRLLFVVPAPEPGPNGISAGACTPRASLWNKNECDDKGG